MPGPEPAHRRRVTQSIIIVSTVVGVLYMSWRAAFSLSLHVWWVSLPLLFLEAQALIGLVLFATSLWDLDAQPPAEPTESTTHRLAILLPTYNEPTEILLPVAAAAVSARLPHSTWVLDDGDRPEVAALAANLGARYLCRPTHGHA